MDRVKWGFDIDGVLCNFHDGFYSYFDKPPELPETWNVDFITDNFHKIENDIKFWENLPRLSNPADISVDIFCYITARPIPSHISYKWLQDNGFPDRPVFSVRHGHQKKDIILHLGVTHFIDDKGETFEQLYATPNVNAYLFDAPHNQYITDTKMNKFRVKELHNLKNKQ